MPETLPDDLIAAEDLPDDLEPATAEPRKPAHAIPLLGKLTELANLPGRYAGSWLAGGLPAEESLIPGVTPESVPPVLPIYPGGPPTEGIPGAIARGALKTGLGLGQYLTSPQGLTELSAGRFAPTALGYKWMLDMATGATDAAKEAYQKAAKGDWEGAAETAVQAGAMGFGLHGVGKGLFGRKGPAAPEAPAAPEVVPEPGGPPPISMGVRTVPNLAALREPTFEPSGLQVGGEAPPSALRQVPSPIEPEPLPGLPAAEPQPIPLRPAAPWELQRVRSEATPLREIQETPAPRATLKTEKLKLAEELPDDLEPVAADVTMGVRTTVPEAPIGKPTFEPSGLGRPATGFEAVKNAAEKLFPGIEIKETSPRVGIEISPDGKTLHLSPRLLDDLAKEYPGRATEAFQKLVQEEVTHHRHLSRLGEGFNEKLADIWENAPDNIKDLVQKIYGKQPGMEPHHWGAELLRMADQAKNVGDITETMHNWNADKAREAVGPLSEWAKEQTGDVAKVLAPEPQTKGEAHAIQPEAAQLIRDVRTQPGEGAGEVPKEIGRPENGGGGGEAQRGRQEGQAQGEVLLNSVAQMAPEEYFANAEKWSKESMAEKGLGPARRAEQAAREFPDAEAWREAYMDAADEARRIRDEVKANPGTMMARQKEMMGAGQKRQFFQEGLKILEGEEGKPQPVDVATESARISEPVPAPAPAPAVKKGKKATKVVSPKTAAEKVQNVIEETIRTEGVQSGKDAKKQLVKVLEDEVAKFPEQFQENEPKYKGGDRPKADISVRGPNGEFEYGKVENGSYGNWTFTESTPAKATYLNPKQQPVAEVKKPFEFTAGSKAEAERIGYDFLERKARGQSWPPPQVKIEIPGDGEFTIVRSPRIMAEMLRRANALETSATPPKGYKEIKPTKAEGQEYLKESEVTRTTEPPSLSTQMGGPFGIPDIAAVYRATKQLIDEFASTKTAFGLRKLAERLLGQRDLIRRMIQTGDTRKAIIYTRDAADNTANLFARQMANEVRAPMRSDFKDDAKVANDALSFVVESEMNPDRLDAFETQIQNSTRADPYWKKRALEAIQFAKDNWNRLEPHAQRYKQLTDAQVDIEHSGGVDTLKRNGYVPHRQDVVDAFGMSGGSGEAAGFRKVRDFNTFADSIAAGMDPKSLNAVDLLESRIRSGQSMVNKRAWIDAFKNRLDKQTGQPIAVKPNIVTRADGTTYPEAPQGYSLETLNNQPIAVHNGYEGLIGALSDPSWFMRSKTGQNFMKGLGASKSVKLMIDSFHLARVGFWNAALRSAGITTFKAPKGWSYKQGLTLLDFTESQIRDMARKGEIPQEWLPSLVQDKQRLTEMVNQGYNVGKISDSMYQDWIHNIPGIGDFNKFLFDKFQRGAMAEIGLLEFERLKRARPNMPDAQIARQVARDLNTRFGNLGRQGIFKSRTGQDIARTIALAPQWNEGLIRSEIFGAGQVVKAVIEAAQGKRIYMGTLGRALTGMVLAQFAANQLINMYTRGHPTWDNPEEGLGAKLSAWIPNPTWLGAAKDAPGFFLHPMGLAAETSHLLMQWYERTGDFRESLSNYIRSRASTALSPILTFITNSDFLGRKLKPGTVWGQMVKDAIPRPIPTDTVSGIVKSVAAGEGRQQYQGQFQKQLMASFGIKSENAPSPVARIGKLAKDFNAEHGVEPSAEFYVGDYTPATSLLAIGNTTDAKDKLAELMTKKTPRAMVDHFEKWVRHPFTGSKSRERQFFEGLNDEQKQQYALALERRKDLAIQAIRLVVELNREQQEKEAAK